MFGNISNISQLYNNLLSVFKYISSTYDKENKVMKLWININTGEMNTDIENKHLNKEWKEIRLIKSKDNYSLDVEEANIGKEVKAVVKATAIMLNAFGENIKVERKMDHLPTLSEIVEQHPEKDLIELNHLMAEAISIFGPEEFQALPTTLKDLAQEVFRLTTQKLEKIEPIKEKDVSLIFDLLFNTALKKECQNKGKTHPSSIISKLHDAMSHFKKVGKEKALVPTAGKKGKFLGANSSYFLLGNNQQKLWVFKPLEGESGYQDEKVLFAGIKPGKGAKREHVAHLLNSGHIYPIPYTVYISLGGQVGSAQLFVSGTVSFGALETDIINPQYLLKIPLKPMQCLVIYDIRFRNCDRHGGNILCSPNYESGKKLKNYDVFGIDHGGSMTSSEKDPLKMTYLRLSQLIRFPFDEDLKKYILEDMNIEKDAEIMKKHQMPEMAIHWMENASNFLRLALKLSEKSFKNGKNELTASDIGFLALTRSDLIWNFTEKMEDVKDHLLDILFCKDHLSGLKKEGKLKAGRYKRLEVRGFNQSRGKRKEIWMENLFDRIMKPFFDHLQE